MFVGMLLFFCGMLFVAIGNYHYETYMTISGLSTKASFYREKDTKLLRSLRKKTGSAKTIKMPSLKDDNTQVGPSPVDERAVFDSIIKRVKWTENQCNNVPEHYKRNLTSHIENATDLSSLPERGVAVALEQWMQENKARNSYTTSYPPCYLPPPKSCDVTTYTLVIMSHNTERLHLYMDPLADMIDTWPGLTEIIHVWNSPRTALMSVDNENEQQYATKLLSWDEDPNHPLRIFFAMEEGLVDNLLNRYHPKIQPKNEALMFFDDDGPFLSKEVMVDGGLELWKRNSNVQVGAFPRNIRFLSSRMKDIGKKGLEESIDIIKRNVHSDDVTAPYPSFTPLCRDATGDHIEYNHFSFPDFNAHVLLPSGSILHRNYLCFIWHPAFAELREWVKHHRTMPDDITVSMLVSHLVGKAPRSFPRRINNNATNSIEASVEDDTKLTIPNQSHRRLMWEQKGWFKMREEAANGIIGYFGSVHPGTAGWCAGTKYMQLSKDHKTLHCNPKYPPRLSLLPWLKSGGLGYDHCPN
jgi:hypothetical protein